MNGQSGSNGTTVASGGSAGAEPNNAGSGGAVLSSGGAGSANGGAGGGTLGTAGALGNAGSSADGGGETGTAGAAGTAAGTLSAPDRLVLTGVRGVATPAAASTLTLHNGSTSSATVSALTLTGANAALFQITSPPALPLMLAPGADQSLTLALLTSSAGLPAAPAQNDGATALSTTLSVTSAGGSVQTSVFGLVLTTATHEPTLGEILTTLGYKLNVGQAQNNANPNTGGTTATLPGVEAGTDEISAQLFQKAGTGNVTLETVARFSPKAPCPFGWYPMGAPGTKNTAGTMADTPDAQTSDKARMVSPPVTGPQSFDPGTQTFGIWVYTDQLSQKYDTGGSAANGDYDYSEDAANSPANTHRTKAYPLKNAAGVSVANSYLLAIEEAANGDYQDYVMVLGNAKVAP